MSDNSFDERTINKIIPQIFKQKRSTLDTNALTSKLQASMTQISSLATQSLIQESESLDKIIDTMKNVNKLVSTSTPANLNRIYEVCKSTNFILDTWINIQSQASYSNKLMNDEDYIKYLKAKDEGKDLIAEETKEVESLRQELNNLKQNQSLKDDMRKNTQGRVIPPRTHISTSNNSINNMARNRTNGSAIPRIANRVSKPTASSQRKMFRR